MNAQTKTGWTITIATGATSGLWLNARGVGKDRDTAGPNGGHKAVLHILTAGKGKSMETCESLGGDSKRASKKKA